MPKKFRIKKQLLGLFIISLALINFVSSAWADVAIEASVDRSRLPVGEQLVYAIVVSNANGKIEQPQIGAIDGFTAYSQGHSQELSIINGRSSSKSIFSYVLVANSTGQKSIGPFEISIGGKKYVIAPVKIEVVGSTPSNSSNYTWVQAPVQSPSPKAMPSPNVANEDIFVKAWLDKDEVYVNEGATLTYTLFTRLPATYKGFEKEPVTTGFWVEDYPPDKIMKRQEQYVNGQRYVVADVRKFVLYPTQSGVFTIDPGVLSTTVEVRSQDNFESFFSNNVFGSRRTGFPSSFGMNEVIAKPVSADPVRLVVKSLPENAKPKDFSGAVGQYDIESSIDKNDVEVGDPVTLRMKISGKGNINSVQNPKLPIMENFKVYDSSTSSSVNKEKEQVSGEKITETVIVPKRPGLYEIPSASFSYFDPQTGEYRTLKTEAHRLNVKPVAGETYSSTNTPSTIPPQDQDTGLEPASKENVDLVSKDIRFIKSQDDKKYLPDANLPKNPIYWGFNLFWVLLSVVFAVLSSRKNIHLSDSKGFRMRRSQRVAQGKLRLAAKLMKQSKTDEFYAEISHAVLGYFADKFNIPLQAVTIFKVEELSAEYITSELLGKIKKLFGEMSLGRFSKMQNDQEHMSDVYDLAQEVLASFEKVKLK